MDLELKRTVIKVSIYGEAFEFRRPTAGEYQKFTKDVSSGLNEETAIGHMKTLLLKCKMTPSMTEEKIDSIEMEHLTEIFNSLVSAKKK